LSPRRDSLLENQPEIDDINEVSLSFFSPVTNPPVSTLIVSYNTRNLLDGCLRSLRRIAEDLPLDVIVVDNASTDGSALHVRTHFPEVRIIPNEKNIGFAAAVNRGMSEVHSSFVFVLNPDTIVPRETIQKLLNYIKMDEKCALVGANLTNPDGSMQASIFRFPSLFREFWNFLPEIKLLLRFQKLGTYVHSIHVPEDRNAKAAEEAGAVECISGAAFLMRTEAFKSVGGMDERFFLYHEEMDLCTRMRRAGWQIRAHRTAQVIHFDAQASGYTPKRLPNAPVLNWRIGGMDLLWQKHKPGLKHTLWRVQAKGLLRFRIGLCFLALPFSGKQRLIRKKRIGELVSVVTMLRGNGCCT